MTTHSTPASSTRTAAVVSIGLIGLFAILTVVVHFRLLADFDLGFARALQSLSIWPAQELATATGILMASQMAVVYALLAALLLWRAGLRLWVLSPFTFLMSTVVEIVMKTAVNQSGERLMEFHRSTYYPFATVSLDGTFPSGHSSRTAFFCVFLAVLLWSRGTMLSRAAAVGFIVLIPLVGFTRLYIGDHWLSDVAAGILLGAALALLVAPPVAARLQKANSYLPSVVRK